MSGASQVVGRLDAAWVVIADVFRNPGVNREASLLVFGSLFLLLLLAVLLVVLAVTSPRRSVRPQVPAVSRHSRRTRTPAERHGRLVTGVALAVVLGAVVWAVSGVTTGSNVACESCHADSPHAASAAVDAHADVACVSCHETGGPVARVGTNLPARLAHYARGAEASQTGSYGTQISSAGCRQCHRDALTGMVTDTSRGIRMSHAEPLDAGAACVDCHALSGGVVSRRTVGMDPCLRCHDGKTAPASCSACHTADPGAAIAARETSPTAYASELVSNPTCDGCHDMRTCDACHGVPMPHTAEFKASGHARQGAEELWRDGGKKCSLCHYEDRRPCTACHEQAFLAHGPQFKELHKSASWDGVGCTCHNYRSPVQGRNFCAVCHADAAKRTR